MSASTGRHGRKAVDRRKEEDDDEEVIVGPMQIRGKLRTVVPKEARKRSLRADLTATARAPFSAIDEDLPSVLTVAQMNRRKGALLAEEHQRKAVALHKREKDKALAESAKASSYVMEAPSGLTSGLLHASREDAVVYRSDIDKVREIIVNNDITAREVQTEARDIASEYQQLYNSQHANSRHSVVSLPSWHALCSRYGGAFQ